MSFRSAPAVSEPAEPTLAGDRTPPGLQVLRAGSLRSLGISSALSLTDQVLTSAASFGVNVVLARWMGAEVYGAFAVAFATFLFVSGIHNAIVVEPLSVIGPSRYPQKLVRYLTRQIVVHGILTGALSVTILVLAAVVRYIAPQSPLVGAIAGGGLALPFLLLLWLARRMCYVNQSVKTAVFGSSFYFLFVAAGLVTLRHFDLLSPFLAFVLTGLGSLLSALLLFAMMGISWRELSTHDEFGWRRTLAENWHYGRWVVASTLLNSVSMQVQTILVATILGLSAAGVLRAMQLPMLAMVNALGAAGPLVLPSFSRDFGAGRIAEMRHKARLVSLGLGAAELCFVGLLALVATPAANLIFGGKYTDSAWMMPVLCLIPVFLAGSMGFAHAMRASHRPQFDLAANALAASVAIISVLTLMPRWGLSGAVASMVLASLVYAASVVWTYHGYNRLQPHTEPI